MKPSSNIDLEQSSGRIDESDASFDRRIEKIDIYYDCFNSVIEGRFMSLTNGDYHATQDLCQEFWRRVLLKLPEEQMGELGILLSMAYQVFSNKYWHSASRRREIPVDEVPEPETGTSFFEPSSAGEEAEFRESFFAELPSLTLSEKQKDALWLYARNGETMEAISAQLGVGKSTVGDWISLARQQIRQALENED